MEKIKEFKRHTETNISVGSFDCLKEGDCLFQDLAVKFPIKKKPADNECFAGGVGTGVPKEKKKSGKRKSKRLAKRRAKYKGNKPSPK